jgi:hypothetical protein
MTNRRRFATDEEVDVALVALRSTRPAYFTELYMACDRSSSEDADDPTPPYRPQLDWEDFYGFLGSLPLRPHEADRLKVATDLYTEIAKVVKWSEGPWGYRVWKRAHHKILA